MILIARLHEVVARAEAGAAACVHINVHVHIHITMHLVIAPVVAGLGINPLNLKPKP